MFMKVKQKTKRPTKNQQPILLKAARLLNHHIGISQAIALKIIPFLGLFVYILEQVFTEFLCVEAGETELMKQEGSGREGSCPSYS